MSWEDNALCAETDIDAFHPEKGDHAAVKRAKSICAVCRVRTQCLEYAIANRVEYGIWGGMTASARATLLRGAA